MRMKAAEGPFNSDHDKEVRKVLYTIGRGPEIYLDRAPIVTSAPERLATDSYSKLMPPETVPFKILKLSPTTVTIDEDGVRNSISINQATLAPSAKFAERQFIYKTVSPANEPREKVKKGRGKTNVEELDDVPGEYTVHCIVQQFAEHRNVKDVGLWYSYTAASDTVRAPEHGPEHFITRCWGPRKKTNAVHRRRG